MHARGVPGCSKCSPPGLSGSLDVRVGEWWAFIPSPPLPTSLLHLWWGDYFLEEGYNVLRDSEWRQMCRWYGNPKHLFVKEQFLKFSEIRFSVSLRVPWKTTEFLDNHRLKARWASEKEMFSRPGAQRWVCCPTDRGKAWASGSCWVHGESEREPGGRWRQRGTGRTTQWAPDWKHRSSLFSAGALVLLTSPSVSSFRSSCRTVHNTKLWPCALTSCF